MQVEEQVLFEYLLRLHFLRGQDDSKTNMNRYLNVYV